MTAKAPQPGTRIADRYLVESRLGAGAMGVVLRARDERLDRVVALKVLGAGSVGDAQATTRLIREAKATAALEHPHIVPIYDVGPTGDGGAYLAMQLVKGETLRSRLKREGSLSLEVARRIISEIGAALAFAHESGIVHRDVKPDNVMMRQEDGRAVVLDFGLAKRLTMEEPDAHTLTAEGSIVGTPAYLSPEQARGEEIDGRTDQFALAVMTYELLSGRIPWRGASIAALLASLMTDEPPRLVDRVSVPAEVSDAVARALSRDPASRFAAVEDFLEAIGAPSTMSGRPPRASKGARPVMAAPSVANAFAETLASGDPVETTPRDEPRKLSPLVIGALALAALGVAAWVASGLLGDADETLAVVDASTGAGPTTLETLPPPNGCSDAAVESYHRAMLLIRSGNWGPGCEAFDQATSRDDTCAAALLRKANCAAGAGLSGARDAFLAAQDYSDELTERDRALLNALEPLFLTEPPNRGEYASRLAALPARFVDDAEFLVMAGDQSDAPLEQRRTWAARSVEIDSEYSDGYQVHARVLTRLGRREEARSVLSVCKDRVPRSGDCILQEMHLLREEGRCDEARILAGDLRTRAPASDLGVRLQVKLEAAAGATEETVAGTIEHVGRSLEGAERERERASLRARHAALRGRMEVLLAHRVEIGDASGAWGPAPFWLAAFEVSALSELGRVDEAVARATETVRGRRAELSEIRIDPYVLYHEVVLIDGAQAGLDEEAYAEALAALDGTYQTGGFVDPVNRWAAFTARRADDIESARAALEALSDDLPEYGEPATLAYTGRALLLAGRPEEAIPRLERVARGCELFDYPFLTTRALLWLSDAYEEAGNQEAACTAAREILTRWGENAPTARTVLDAHVRLSACGGTVGAGE